MALRNLLMLLAALLGCDSGEKKVEADSAPALTFASARIRLVAGADTVPLLAELAEKVARHARADGRSGCRKARSATRARSVAC